MNRTLLAKLNWSLANEDRKPLVIGLLKKYCRRDSFWAVNQKSLDFFLWKNLIENGSLLCKGSCTLVNRGDKVVVKHQPWILWLNYSEFMDLMSRHLNLFPHLNSVANLSLGNWWNEGLVISIFGGNLGRRILEIPKLPTSTSNKIIWKPKKNAVFSVKSAYVEDKKSCFGVKVDLGSEFGTRRGSLHQVIENWISNSGTSRSKALVYIGCVLTVILQQRNTLRIYGKTDPFFTIVHKLKSYFGELWDPLEEQVRISPLLQNVGTPYRFVTMTDASWSDGVAGLGVVLIDTVTSKWFLSSSKSKSGSILEAETVAILTALQRASQCY
uniref:RNase H type-1 domain-containing protein n=1 Tax=Cannabis sativa TaxID=3483 RepID=A0A803P5D7_CANSA